MLAGLCISCVKYHDPAYETLDNYSFGFQVMQGQKYKAGDTVGDSIQFYVVHNTGMTGNTATIAFEVLSGGGSLTVTETKTNSNGIAYTGWKLGYDSPLQKIRAKVYDNDGNYLSYTDLFEYGFRKNRWDEISESPDGGIIDMAADTVNNITLMVSGGQVYRQGDEYFDWQVLTVINNLSFSSVEIDRSGIFYLSTWDGSILKSTDGGNTWLTCTKPYPDLSISTNTYVANDNSVWVFAYNYPTKYSYDGGMTWNIAGSNLSQWGYGDIFRMKDGSLLFHGSNCCSLNRSTDNGATWTPVATPGLSIKLYVDDDDNIYIVTQENGLSIYRSSDGGGTFDKVYSIFPQWGTSMQNTFNKWHNTYYILIPGYGILKSEDLIHYTVFWANDNLSEMFIDDKGTLIARDHFMHDIYYYSADPQ